jgi:hypothetical protein
MSNPEAANQMAKTLARLGTAPCDDCPSYNYCGDKKLACPEYWWYTQGPIANCNGKKAFGKPYIELTQEQRETPTANVYAVCFPKNDS